MFQEDLKLSNDEDKYYLHVYFITAGLFLLTCQDGYENHVLWNVNLKEINDLFQGRISASDKNKLPA